MEGYYNIAGLTVKMSSSGRTISQSSAYRIEPCTNYDISISTSCLLSEGISLEELWPDYSPDSREYLATGYLFYRYLLDFDGMMLHSSCVVVDGRAYLFTAASGTGKSTHTTMYLDLFKGRAYILNDDKPAVRLVDGVWYAYGTPWSGKNDLSVNERVPIAGIAILERGKTNEIERCTGVYAIQEIMKQVNRPKWADYRIKLLQLMDKLITQVPIWKLKCNMSTDAVVTSYEAMSGQKFTKEI